MNGTDAKLSDPGGVEATPGSEATPGATPGADATLDAPSGAERDWSERLASMDVVELDPLHTTGAVMAALAEVPDPELGLDIVALGLVYGLHRMGENVTIMMTLTTPGCPMHGSIRRDVLRAMEQLPGMGYVDVQLVWDPPWTPDRISEEGRRQLYWL